MKRLIRLLCAPLALASIGAPVAANAEYEWEAEQVHSDLPLYTFDWEELWPRSLDDPDIIAGCGSRVGFGDWRFTPNPDDEYGETSWYRIRNYGTFHCAANLFVSDAREDLDEGEFSRGLFVKIGRSRRGGKPWELWVLQVGFLPGSDYILLAREENDEGLIEEFTVLQRRCPRSKIREVDGMDIWLTRYCSINSRTELLSLAKRMLSEPALGTIARAENEEEPDTEVPDPSISKKSA
ncbi:MAG: hypothetical protein AAF250_09205 [Pseudomonadota bacterium]